MNIKSRKITDIKEEITAWKGRWEDKIKKKYIYRKGIQKKNFASEIQGKDKQINTQSKTTRASPSGSVIAILIKKFVFHRSFFQLFSNLSFFQFTAVPGI